jgi:hypothetical protein
MTMERTPPHSIDAIRASRLGGRKEPKRYRKYQNSANKEEKSHGQGITQGFIWVARGLRRAFEALR